MKRFKKLYVEITNICNLSCSFCPKTKRKQGYMDIDLFERILKEGMGRTKHLYFHVMGEPLLHPKLREFLSLAHDYGYRTDITTNGTLLKNKADVLLTAAGLRQVSISLHCIEANEGCYTIEEYINNIFAFINKAKDTELSVSLRLWNLEANEREKNQYILSRIENEFKLEYSLLEEITKVNGIRIGERLFLKQAAKFNWPDINLEPIGTKGFCMGLRQQLAILVDGTVVPCCLDSEGTISLGNIKEQGLEQIINAQRAKAMYDGFSRQHITEKLCERCDYRNRFMK